MEFATWGYGIEMVWGDPGRKSWVALSGSFGIRLGLAGLFRPPEDDIRGLLNATWNLLLGVMVLSWYGGSQVAILGSPFWLFWGPFGSSRPVVGHLKMTSGGS